MRLGPSLLAFAVLAPVFAGCTAPTAPCGTVGPSSPEDCWTQAVKTYKLHPLDARLHWVASNATLEVDVAMVDLEPLGIAGSWALGVGSTGGFRANENLVARAEPHIATPGRWGIRLWEPAQGTGMPQSPLTVVVQAGYSARDGHADRSLAYVNQCYVYDRGDYTIDLGERDAACDPSGRAVVGAAKHATRFVSEKTLAVFPAPEDASFWQRYCPRCQALAAAAS